MKGSNPWFQRTLGSIVTLLCFLTALSQSPGSIDAPFAPTGVNGGAVLTDAPGGKVVISGGSLYQSVPSFVVRPALRLLPNGGIDPTFDLTEKPGEVNGHVITDDGHLMLYGRFDGFNGHPTRCVVRLKDDATTDTSFTLSVPGTSEATAVLPLPGGGAYVVFTEGRIARITAAGAVDPGFALAAGAPTLPLMIALQPSGKVLVVQNGTIFRLHATGQRDATYIETTFPNVVTDRRHVAVAPDGGLYVASNTQPLNGGALRTLVRLLPEGGVDPAFTFVNDGASAGSRSITTMVLQNDGRLVLQGTSMTPTGLFRVTPSGSLDPAFATFTSNVSVLGLESSGKILAIGFYLQFSPTVIVRNGLVRLLNDAAPAQPILTANPTPLSVNAGQPATFAVTASGSEPLSYRWQFNGADLPDSNARLYNIPAAFSLNAGPYRVIVSNPNGSVTSAPVTLTVISQPSISQQPLGFAAVEGNAGSLDASVTGEPPLALQWFQDGHPVFNATSTTLPFPALTPSDAGNYQLVANNAFGSATSAVAKVTVYAARPQWLVLTNATTPNVLSNADNPFRPDAALKVVPDAPRGPVVLHSRGVERWNDAGQRLWTVRYIEPDFGSLSSIAVDKAGNVYVAGILHFTGTLGDLPMTNNSAVTGPNGHQQVFIAKLDPDGHGLWYRLYEAAGPAIGSLTVAADDDVVFVGSNGGKQGRSYLGNLSVFEDDYMAAILGKIGSDGTPHLLKSFTQYTFNRSTCEADSVVADASGLYVSGLISFSIQFGTLQLQSTGGWLGKLSTAGEPQWIKATVGLAGQGDPLVLRGGQLWKLTLRDRTLQHWGPDGTLLTSFNAAGSVAGDTALLRQIGINGAGELLLLGSGTGATRVGASTLNPGTNRKLVWMGRWGPAGDFVSSRILAATTNVNPSFDSVTLASYAVADNGDLYALGSFANAFRLLGANHTVPPNGYAGDRSVFAAWFTKQSAASLQTPEFTQQPIESYLMQTGDAVRIGVKTSGVGPITYQWRHNGLPVPGETADFHQFTDATVADSGAWDCVATNPFGSSSSDVSAITVAPPFQIRQEPSPQIVLLNGAVLTGTAIDVAATRPGAFVGKQLAFVITQTSSPRFPLGGTFTASFAGGATAGTYAFAGTGVLGLHQGTWFPTAITPELSDLFLNKFFGLNSATLGLTVGGTFDLHYDIADADGCCATGTFGISGGTASATFQTLTTFFVPAGNYQWQKDGVNLPGQTSALLTIPTVTAADAGVYRCVVTYRGYSETSEPAPLRVVDGGTSQPPVLTFTPFAPGATGMTLSSWPAGFVLQRTVSLATPDWQTIATAPPVTIPFALPGEFFRLVPGP